MPLLKESELILNPDGSVYHLNLRPEDIADDIITVGDPDRVEQVSKYFDSIDCIKHKREFKTISGRLSGKRLSVISTGIGTDNIDIVMNELDALVNIDLESRSIKEKLKKLRFYRIGTSGAIDSQIGLDSFLVSKYAIGLDGLMQFYKHQNPKLFETFLSDNGIDTHMYIASSDSKLFQKFHSKGYKAGITITAAGFYGPQQRELRLESKLGPILSSLEKFVYEETQVSNLEMETAGIYSLGKLLGHSCVSLNAILANRKTGGFSKEPRETVERLIKKTLEIIVEDS